MTTTVNGVKWGNGENHPDAQKCSACWGDGWGYRTGFPTYRKVTCDVCEGSGLMVRLTR